MKGLISKILLGLGFFVAAQGQMPAERPVFEKERILIKDIPLTVEVAQSDRQREFGLMHKTKMGDEEGMLFVFPREEIRRFWMKNTRIPLAIAFVNSKGTVVDIQEMVPESEISRNPVIYTSAAPAVMALEMNRGWFKRKGVVVGDRLLRTGKGPTKGEVQK